MKKLNVGVIGHGWVATAHIPAINATGHAQVTAIYSARPLDEAALSKQYGSPIKAYSDLKALFADPSLDVIDICSFPKEHPKQFLAALAAGKHVICEKPLALAAKDLELMAAAVRKAPKLRTCVNFEVRWSSQFKTIKSVLDAGLLGDVHFAEVDYYHGVGPWYGQFRWSSKKAEGGSSLLSAGCHALDALLMCLEGAVPVEVMAYATASKSEYFAPYDFPTTQLNIVKFADGRVGKTTSCLDCLQPYYFHTHLVGSHGTLLDDKFHSTKLGGLNKAKWSHLSCGSVDSGDVKDHPYESQFRAYFEAIAADREMPQTSFWDAYKSHKLIFAADKSAATGKPVRLQ